MRRLKRFNLVERDDIVKKSQQCLWSKEGEPAREYLMDSRCLSEKVVRRFNLGYLPKNLNHQLADRIIFPIYDPSGNLIAVSSRMVEKTEGLPVYWHESYEKRFYLYGIREAKESARKWSFIVLVEGQTDVLQMHTQGMSNTVGLCGSKLSDIQLAMIYRYCEEIIILLDRDANLTGQRATVRLMYPQLSYKQISSMSEGKLLSLIQSIQYSTHSPKIGAVILDEQSDPDEFIRKHGFGRLKNMIRKKVKEVRCAD